MSNNLTSNQSVLAFDGQDDYLVIPNNNNINFAQNQNFCIELWLKVGTIEPAATTMFDVNVIEKWQGTAFPYAIRYSSTRGTIYCSRYDGKNPSVSSKILVNDQKFHHIAFVKQDSQLFLYVDGIEQSQTQDIISQSTKNSSALYVAAGTSISKGGGGRRFFAGQIADLRLWNTARTAEEIQKNMNSRLTGNESGLVAYYPLNGDSNDKTSNANHGKINGAIWQQEELPIQEKMTSSPAKTIQTVLSFDGIDDYVALPAANIDFSEGLTFEAWAKYSSFQQNWSRIIEFGNGANQKNIVLGHVGTSNTLGFHLYSSAGTDTIEVPNALEIGKWVHLVITIDKSGLAQLYKDGQLIQSKPFHLPDNLNRKLNYIAKSSWSNDGYFQGQITEVRVWNIARTAEAIQQNMNSRLTGNEPGLVAYYPLNGDSNDKTSNANNGTINGAIWQQEELPFKLEPASSPQPVTNNIQSALTLNGLYDCVELAKGLPTLDKAITIEFWAKGESNLTQGTSIIEAYNAQNVRVLNIHLPWGGRIYWDAGNENGSDRLDKEVKLEEYNEWTHWAFVKDVPTGTMLIYRNGEIWFSGDNRKKSLIGGVTKFVIGSFANYNNFWKGSITELRIWNTARTQTEIKQNINNRLVGNESGLAAYYSLSGDSNDKTNNANHGFIHSANWTQQELPLPKIESPQPQAIQPVAKNIQSVLTLNGLYDCVELAKGLPTVDKAITIEFWAKGESNLTQGTSIIEAYNAQNVRVLNIHLPWGGRIYWDAGNENGSDRLDKEVKLEEYNEWTHWAFVKDPNNGNGKMLIYRNGEIWLVGYNRKKSLAGGVTKFVIGSFANYNNFWKGSITELRIWNTARTQTEIKQNINNRLVGNESGLAAYYSLSGDSNDKTNNANHGFIHSANWTQQELPLPKIESPQPQAIQPVAKNIQSVLKFDGIDDRVELSKGLPTLDKAITIEFWAKGESNLTQGTSIIEAYNAQNNRALNIHLPWNGRIYWDAGNENGSDRIDKEVKLEEYNEWTHWAFVKDPNNGNGKMLIYRNGEIWLVGYNRKKSLLGGVTKFVIGSLANYNNFWKGSITELRIWNTARTQTEIKQNINNRLAGNELGLVGYYPLNGDSNDKTSNANNGTINGAVWQQEELPIQVNTNNNEMTNNLQSVVMFDGKDDYLEIPYNQSLNPATFTVSAWVKVIGGQGTWRSVITSRDENPLRGYIIYAGDNNKWQAWVGNGKGAWEAVTGSEVILNTWTHVISVFDGSQLKLYLNGVQVDTKTVGYVPNSQRPLRIGTGGTEGSPRYFYGGYIAEVSVWNKALTQTEIQAKMNQRLTGNEAGLVAYWPLNEGSGSLTTDKTGKGNNGTINGAIWQKEELPISAAISTDIERNVITGGNTPTKYAIADTATNFYIVDTNNPVNGNGELTEWEIWAENTLPVQLVIYRKEADIWSVVGNSEIKTPVVGLNQFSLSTPIKVNKGDFAGIYHPQAGCVSFFKENSEPWAIGNLSGKVLFTGSGASSTAFSNSMNRTYSLRVKGNVEVATQSSISEFVKVGPKGGSISGTDFELLPDKTVAKSRLKSVWLNEAWAISRLQLEYENIASTSATTYMTEIVGSGGGNRVEISIQPGDYLTKISGTWGRQAPGYVKEEIITIQLETKQGNKSPIFGGGSGKSETEPFVLEAPEGQEIIGFFGSHGGPQDLLVRLGIYCRPISVENQQPSEAVQPSPTIAICEPYEPPTAIDAITSPEPLLTPENQQPPAPSVTPENQQPPAPSVTPENQQPPAPSVTPENQQPPAPSVTPENQQPPAPSVTPENQQPSEPALKLRKGFSYDEAILMATLSKYAYETFKSDGVGTRKVDTVLNGDQEWEQIHTIRNDETKIQGLILKNTQLGVAHQYTISFQGSIFADFGSVDVTDIATDVDWNLMDYGALAIQRARVVREFNLGFESVADEVQLFFKTLRGELKPSDFRRVHQLTPGRKFACITALIDVGGILLGTNFSEQAQDLVAKVVAEGKADKDEELEKILQFVEEQLLDNQSVLTKPIEVWVTGHGLGGSLCQLAALALRRWFGSVANGGLLIKVYAIAAPKIGNQQFVDYYNQQIGEELNYRIENVLDAVPSLPPDPPFPISAIAPEGLQVGNLFFGKYANGGELISVTGIGGQTASISFGSLFNVPFSVPFPHSPETYIELLEQQKSFWNQLVDPAKDVLRPFLLNMLRDEQRREINSVKKSAT